MTSVPQLPAIENRLARPDSSSPRSNGSAVRARSGSGSRASISAVARTGGPGTTPETTLNPSPADTRTSGPRISTTPASISAISSATRETGGPMDRNAFSGVYQPWTSSRYEPPSSRP
ncbi:hypothetical protein Saa2_06234 [Streptomyces acidiscabies]|nr:hypothetical protein Saa2_06234 [Streptomyces acidiscabies]